MNDDDEVRALLGHTADVLCSVDAQGVILKVVAGSSYMGRPPQQLVGRRVDELLPPKDAAVVKDGITRCIRDQAVVVVEHERSSPTGPRFMRARVTPARGNTILVHVVDVTAEATTRAALETTRERYALLARATTDAIFDWDVILDRVTWNEQLTSSFGYDSKTETTLGWWLERVHADDVEPVRTSVEAAMNDPHKDIWTGEYRFRARDGTFREVFDRALLMRDGSGSVIRVIGSLLDVTDRKRVAEQLATSDRILALGTLGTALAHEVNGPLNYVLGNLAVALEHLRRDDACATEVLLALNDAHEGAQRIGAIVAGLQARTRSDEQELEHELEHVDLAGVVDSALKMIEPSLKKRATIEVLAGASVHSFVRGDHHQLAQVVGNLVTNALQALSDKPGCVIVRLGDAHDNVTVSVEDNGHGIDDAIVPRLFNPFFSTKGGRGSGLGLAVARAVIHRHGGEITVRTQIGIGTVFTMTLPREARAPRHAAAVAPMDVLVVDDDELTRRMIVRALEGEHNVTPAASVAAAFEILTSRRFDVVLSDLQMPDADGRHLKEMLATLPEAPTFAFLSGDEEALRDGANNVPSLKKPFSPEALRHFVRALRHGERGPRRAS